MKPNLALLGITQDVQKFKATRLACADLLEWLGDNATGKPAGFGVCNALHELLPHPYQDHAACPYKVVDVCATDWYYTGVYGAYIVPFIAPDGTRAFWEGENRVLRTRLVQHVQGHLDAIIEYLEKQDAYQRNLEERGDA